MPCADVERPMAYTTRSDAREVVCPECGAQAGEKCVGARDRRRESVHRGRMNAAAEALSHPPIATFRLDGHKLLDSDGNVIGNVTNVEFDLQLEVLVGNLRRGEREVVEVEKKEERPLSLVGSAEGPAQAALIADPVIEVWELYAELLERPRAVLTPKVRRWISAALQVVGIEEVKQAVRGLAASDYHRQNGYVGIEYAIRPKQGETIEGRVAQMSARAPKTSNGVTTVEGLIATLPSEVRPMVHGWVGDVLAWLRSPEHKGLKATAEGRLRDLRERAHIAPVIEHGRLVRWERV